MDSEVNYLNQLVVKLFTKAMKQTFRGDPRADNYEENLKTHLQRYRFSQRARDYFNELNNIIILGGNYHSSEELTIVQRSILGKLEFDPIIQNELYQEINDADRNNWNDSFGYIVELENFRNNLSEIFEREERQTTFKIYKKYLDEFILKLEQLEDSDIKLLNLMDDEIGHQKYDVNSGVIRTRAKKESNEIIAKIFVNKIREKKSHEIGNIEELHDHVKKFKEQELELLAQKKILEKKYDKASLENSTFNLDGAIKSGTAQLKKYPKWMDRIAGVGILGILALMILSITCPVGCTPDGFIEENGVLTRISEVASTVTILENKTLFGPNENLSSIALTTTTNPSEVHEIRNPYRDILESNVMYVLISTIIAPVAVKTLKQKYDIDVEEKQISMIIADGIKSTSMYTNEADKLRNRDGKIPRKYQEALRAKAFKSIKQNYEPKKYQELISSVGSQVFDKAIEHAVETKKIDSFPLAKKQVKEIIKQAIDATPKIIKWKDLDSEVKASFINGNVRGLLQNTGAEGWAYRTLESEFDAEISKRIIAVGLAAQKGIIKNLDDDDTYLQYTSDFVDMVYSTLTNPNNN